MSATIDLGIDLGTTNSAIACLEGSTVRLLEGPAGESLLPSAVYVGPDGELLVGQAARDRQGREPDAVALEFKRQMGTTSAIEVAGRTMSPEALSAKVLGELLAWGRASGREVDAAVITIPAMFELPQCDATRRAAELAGVSHVVLLQEPIAAAVAHSGETGRRDGYWLVYDLGGGTFDVSLVRARRGRLQVLDHDGDNHLGGRDLDRALARWAVDEIRAEGRFGEFRRTDPRYESAFRRLRAEAERARIALSYEAEVELRVDALVDSGHGAGEPFARRIDRALLEERIAPVIGRTTRLCRELLARNQVAAKELEAIVLVGGPTRTPCLPKIIEEDVGIGARHEVDPLSIVARGAALFASTQKRPRSGRRAASGVELHLEYETMTTNPEPLVVGKSAELAGGAVRAERADGTFDSGFCAVSADGKFALDLELVPGKLNVFRLEARAASGGAALLDPAEIRILHGFSVANPPLSQSVGVMLADNTVAWYLRKGAVLPARGSQTHATTMSLRAGQSGEAVHVPLVQGESARADRNRVIGLLRIQPERLTRDLPAGSEVRVEIVVDESSQTKGRAYVPLLDQWFDDVVAFEIEARSGEDVGRSLSAQKDRLAQLEALSDQLDDDDGPVDERVREVEELLEEGDRDSVDLADSLVRMMAARIDQVESKSRVDELKANFDGWYNDTLKLVNEHGDPGEVRQLEALSREFDGAIAQGDLDLAGARFEDLRKLYDRVVVRSPGFWIGMYDYLRKRLEEQGLGSAAQLHIATGAHAIEIGDWNALARAAMEMNKILPLDERQAIDGGVVSHIK